VSRAKSMVEKRRNLYDIFVLSVYFFRPMDDAATPITNRQKEKGDSPRA